MPKVRSNAADRWVRKAGQSTQDYAEGVQSPRVDWASATRAAEAAYNSGVQAAISRKAWPSGVNRAGTPKWQRKAVEVGAPRFGPGVSAAQADYLAGVGPYLQTIESTTLPPRGPKGDPNNIQRVAVIAAALRNKKLQMQGGGANTRLGG